MELNIKQEWQLVDLKITYECEKINENQIIKLKHKI